MSGPGPLIPLRLNSQIWWASCICCVLSEFTYLIEMCVCQGIGLDSVHMTLSTFDCKVTVVSCALLTLSCIIICTVHHVISYVAG